MANTDSRCSDTLNVHCFDLEIFRQKRLSAGRLERIQRLRARAMHGTFIMTRQAPLARKEGTDSARKTGKNSKKG
jgi:hypothetical protein